MVQEEKKQCSVSGAASKVFAVKHKAVKERMDSRSGGAFTALSDVILNQRGVVYGCALDGNFQAVHIRAETVVERNRLRGSKYVQSTMGDVFQLVKADLEDGREVLFSGTSCQVAGLKCFLSKKWSNLYCVDIVCFGAASPFVWREHLNWQRKRFGEIKSVDFRNKKNYGWHSHVETIETSRKRINSKVYASIFNSRYFMRPSCYECPYKSIIHPGDITIGDYWGIDQIAPDFDDNRGCSLTLINNEKGQALFDAAKGDIDFFEAKIEESMQQPLRAPFPKPEDRNDTWKIFWLSFDKLAKRYGRNGLKQNIKVLLSRKKL